jgi:CubicO group peptidase (beta-lactamase class C family)
MAKALQSEGGMTGMNMDRRGLLRLVATTAIAAAAGRAGAREAGAGFAGVQALIDDYTAKGRVPGAVVGIARPGRHDPLFLTAGRTAFVDGAPMSPDTLFRIYSMTKPITGMAVMQQVALGRLRLDQPIADILPEYRAMNVLVDPAKSLAARPATTPITVRHLLTHTAGFSYSISGNGPLEKEYRRLGLLPGVGSLGRQPGDGALPDLQGFVKALATLPLHAEPGTLWRYSVALDLAGGLLERLTGQAFDTILQRQLFAPLGMASTGFSVQPADLGRLSSNYAWLRPDLTPLPEPRLIDGPARTDWLGPQRLLAGGAGLLSSARDYVRFGQMLLDEGQFGGRAVLPRETARLAMSNLMPEGVFFEKTQGNGAGGRSTLFDTRARPDGTPMGTYGWGGAAGTLFQVDRTRGVAVVVMVQHLPSRQWPLRNDFPIALNRDLGA